MVFTFVVVFTLAVGIGANTAMFSIVNGVLLQGSVPRCRPIVDLNEVERRNRDGGAIAPATFVDWRTMSTTIETMAVYARRTFNVSMSTGEPERLRGAATSSTFFDVLGVSPLLGRQFTRDDAEPGRQTWCGAALAAAPRSADAINQTIRNGQP
jgi:putative ABC transport system permease protein